MHCLLFGFIAISVHAFVVMFMHQLGVPQPMQDAAAPAWRSASRKAESRHPQSRTMEVPPVGRKVETLDESAHARDRDDFAALRKDMRQLISRLSQHLDHVEQPKTAPRAAAAETPAAAAAREPEPVQSAAGVAATLRTDKVGLALAEAVQAMARDAMLAEDAGRTEGGMERPAAAATSLQPRLEQLTARLARAEAEARELGELQARAEAELREVEAAAAGRRRAQRRAQGQVEAAASAVAGATDSASGAAGAAGRTLEQLLETLRAQRPAASPKPTAAAAEPAAAQPAAAKPLPAKPAAAAPRRKPKKEKEDNWEDEWEKEDQEASSVESSHTSLTAEVQAMLAKLMGGGGGGGGGSRGESKASAKKKKGRKAEQPKGERAAQEDGAAAAREPTGAKGQAASRARADKDDFEVHDLD